MMPGEFLLSGLPVVITKGSQDNGESKNPGRMK